MPFSKSNLWSIDWRNCLFSCAEIVLHCRWDLPLDTGFGGRGDSKYAISWLEGRVERWYRIGQTHIAVNSTSSACSKTIVDKQVTMRMEEEWETHRNLPPIKLSTVWEPWRAQAEPGKYVLMSPFNKIIKLPQFELNTAYKFLKGCICPWGTGCVIARQVEGGCQLNFD